MRRHVFAGVVIFVLAIIETSFLPAALGTFPRPNLVLIATAAWAAMRGNEGFLWAAYGGLLLDVLSGAPFGSNMAGLVLGNTLAILLDRVPIPFQIIRVTNWVAVTTVVYYIVLLLVLAFSGRPYNISLAFTNVILPALLINPVLSIPTYFVLSRLQGSLRDQERFLPQR
jgi:rod shape-determining protein MreD